MRAVVQLSILVFVSSITLEANAQNTLNLQTQLDILQPSITKQGLSISAAQGEELGPHARVIATKKGTNSVCDEVVTKKKKVADLTDQELAELLSKYPHAFQDTPQVMGTLNTQGPLTTVLQYRKTVVRILSKTDYFPINECLKHQATSVKLTASFNPTYETNVLKSPSNIHEDRATNFGGQLLVVSGGFRPFDIMAVSIGSASSRYAAFGTKNVDVISTQAAYQFFLDSYGYKAGSVFHMDPSTPKADLLPTGLITVDTLSVAVQNQTSYTPPFQTRTVDLLTPQIQLSRNNISLLGGDRLNECTTSDGAYKKHVFCYFADAYINIGQTFSDMQAQENTNIAASLSLGKRFDGTDWKLAFNSTVTEKIYDHVSGGRRDLLVQVGPTLSYQHPAAKTLLGDIGMGFSLPVSYYNNTSSLAAAEWHGWIVMPTVSMAFNPK